MKRITWDRRTEVEKRIEDYLEESFMNANSMQERTEILEVMSKQYAIRNLNRISKDTIVVVCGNLLGIALILGYEKVNVISSKALGLIIRGRV